MQADGNGSGDYMHSGMRGGPHVGAFRRCSFTEAEIKLQAQSTSISRKPTCWFSGQQVLMMTHFPSALQLLPECSGAPINKPHTLTELHGWQNMRNLANAFSPEPSSANCHHEGRGTDDDQCSERQCHAHKWKPERASGNGGQSSKNDREQQIFAVLFDGRFGYQAGIFCLAPHADAGIRQRAANEGANEPEN